MSNGLLTQELYFTTTTVVDWIDVFTRPVYKQIIIDSLTYCQKEKGLDIYAWVLMSNHLHMVVGVHDDKQTISQFGRICNPTALNPRICKPKKTVNN